MPHIQPLTLNLRILAAWMLWLSLALGMPVLAAPDGNVTTQTHFWVDDDGQAGIGKVAALPADAFAPMEKPRSFELAGALWLRYDVPALDASRHWYLLLEGPSYTNQATLYQRDANGQWKMQQAGDQLPMSQWTRTLIDRT